MNKQVSSYNDLLIRKQQLETLLESQELLIRYEYMELKEHLQPIQRVISTVSDFATRDKKAWILNEAFGLMVDKLIKEVLLSNTGFITRNILPELIKNYSSHYLSVIQEKWVNELISWLNSVGEAEPVENNVENNNGSAT